MRTVTFSNEKVARVINENFVSTWFNRNPDFHNCTLKAEHRIVRNSFEVFPTRNFCTFFLTPNQEVLHYLSGYYSPDLFLQEVRFALSLAEKVLDVSGRLKKGWPYHFHSMHMQHAEKHARDTKNLQKMNLARPGNPTAWEKQHWAAVESRRCNFISGLTYLQHVHKVLNRSVRGTRPIPLEKVLMNYESGNDFTEEHNSKK